MKLYKGFSLQKYSIESIDALYSFRAEQYILAFRRDSGICRRCWKNGKRVNAEQVHHVHGHGTPRNLTFEHYEYLLSLCYRCHDYHHKQDRARQPMIELLAEANAHPLGDFNPGRDLLLLRSPGIVYAEA